MQPVACSARLLILPLLLGACHRTSPRPNIGPKAGQSVGDTAAFGPRLLGDARGPFVTFQVSGPAYVLLVSITPGESAVPVGALTSDSTLAEPGIHSMKFVPVPRVRAPAPSMSMSSGPIAPVRHR
jgi:hypothetical protein